MSVVDVENLRLHYARTLGALERAVRRGARSRPRRVGRRVLPRLGAVPRRLRGRLPDRLDAAVPGRLRAARVGAAILVTRAELTRNWTDPGPSRHVMTRCDAIVVGGGPAGSTVRAQLRAAGWNVVVLDRARFPRDKVCAGWLTPGRLPAARPDAGGVPRERRHAAGDHRVSHAVIGRRPIETRYPRTISYAIRRCEFDDFLLRRAGARVLDNTPVSSIRRAGDRWVVNDALDAPIVVGAGGHFCPVARHLRGGPDTSVAGRRKGGRVPPGRRPRPGRRAASGAALLPRPPGLRLVRAQGGLRQRRHRPPRQPRFQSARRRPSRTLLDKTMNIRTPPRRASGAGMPTWRGASVHAR